MSSTTKWRRFRRIAPTVTVGVIGFAVAITSWSVRSASEDREVMQAFSGRAHNQEIVLQTGIAAYWDKLYAVRALFDSSTRAVARGEFEDFANSLLSRHPAILNVAWIPRVTREQRLAHELDAALDGLFAYRIHTVAPDGSRQAAEQKNEYFPKFYSTEERSSNVYGLDLNDGGTRAQTLRHVRDEDVLSTSAPLMLQIGAGDRRGFWAALPVYARGQPHATVEDRQRNLRGFVQGVFQFGVMIDTIIADVKTPVRLYLFAPGAGPDDLPLYYKSRLDGRPIEARSQASLDGGLHLSFPLHFGDAQWTAVVVPETTGALLEGHTFSTIVLITGLLLCAGLTSFVWAMQRANDRFEQKNLQFDAALNNMVQGLLMYSPSGKLTVSNRRFAEMIGMSWDDWNVAALGTTVPQSMQLVDDLTKTTTKDQARIAAGLQKMVEQNRTSTVAIERTDGRVFSASCMPMTNGGFVITFEDITLRRRDEEKIAYLAHHDLLTDLPNRVLFYEKIDKLLAYPSQRSFAVLSLDLDRFKSVNDTLGHPAGDKLLQAVAERMRACIRDSDVAARLGGDEFAIVQVIVHPNDAIALATRLIDALCAPYQIDGHEVNVGTSVGIATAPNGVTDADALMKQADLALYRAKADGGGVYRFFEPTPDATPKHRGAERRATEAA